MEEKEIENNHQIKLKEVDNKHDIDIRNLIDKIKKFKISMKLI